MKLSKMVLLTLMFLLCFTTFVSASSQPSDNDVAALFKKKYPDFQVTEIKSADVNNDKKKEYFLLDDQAQFWVYQNKKFHLMDGTFYSDDDLEPAHIRFLKQNSKEIHIAVTYEYYPSNTTITVFRMKKDTLFDVLQVTGDRGAFIKGKNIVVRWKLFRHEGGWDEMETIYSWNNTKKTYQVVSNKLNGFNSDNFMG